MIPAANEDLKDHEERINKLESDLKLLRITAGGESNDGGADMLSELSKMINDLGVQIRDEADKKYAAKEDLDKLADDV